jgi:flagellar hook-associated protein 1 FlgK
MSLNITLYNAVTGLQTNQAALQVTSNNITNANTVGYTRKIVNQSHIVIGAQGAGVELDSVTRYVDEYLNKQIRASGSTLGALGVSESYFQRVQDMFGTLESNSSIGASITNLANEFEALAANPESSSQMQTVVANAVATARELNGMSKYIQQLRFDADKEIATAVDVINTQLEQIDGLNEQIARSQVMGAPTGELEDKRDVALSKISEQIDINYFTRSTGELVIFTLSGRTLLNSDPMQLTHTPVSSMTSSFTYPGVIDGIDVNGTDITAEIGSGRLASLIEMRDTTLPDLTAEINALSTSLRDEINRLHNEGSGLPAATTLTSSRAQTGTAATLTGTVRITLLNADGTEAYTAAVAAPGTLDAAGFAAAINTALAGFGGSSASEAGGVVTIDGAGLGVVISGGTVDPGGGLPTTNASDYLHLNDLFVGEDPLGLDNAAVLDVRSDIVADPSLLSRGALQLDPITAAYYVSSGDNSIAQNMADKFNEQLSFAAAGGLPTTTETLAGYGIAILSLVSAKGNTVSDRLTYETAVTQELQFRSSSVSGVNTDEEMSNLILYQNAYAASARLVSVVSEMFATLDNMAR